jgi:hypothetical protein
MGICVWLGPFNITNVMAMDMASGIIDVVLN